MHTDKPTNPHRTRRRDRIRYCRVETTCQVVAENGVDTVQAGHQGNGVFDVRSGMVAIMVGDRMTILSPEDFRELTDDLPR